MPFSYFSSSSWFLLSLLVQLLIIISPRFPFIPLTGNFSQQVCNHFPLLRPQLLLLLLLLPAVGEAVLLLLKIDSSRQVLTRCLVDQTPNPTSKLKQLPSNFHNRLPLIFNILKSLFLFYLFFFICCKIDVYIASNSSSRLEVINTLNVFLSFLFCQDVSHYYMHGNIDTCFIIYFYIYWIFIYILEWDMWFELCFIIYLISNYIYNYMLQFWYTPYNYLQIRCDLAYLIFFLINLELIIVISNNFQRI